MHLDWESRGVADLRVVGLHNYARDEDTDLWLGSYAFGDEEPEVWYPGQPCPPRIVDHVAAGGEIHAWNASFEIALWQQIATPRHGWPELRVENVHCVMARGYSMGLPGALEDAALAMGLQILKDVDGRSLMMRMSKPRSKPGEPLVWWSEPEKIARLAAYCCQDTRVERELHKRLMPLSDHERRVWQLDYKINQQGVQVDVPTAKAAVDLALKMKMSYDEQMAKATAGEAVTCTALGPIKAWLAARGLPSAMDGLDKAAVAAALARTDLSPEIRNVLILRQEAGKASTAKFDAMVKRAGADGRLRGTLQYHGAATGRWAGRGVQVHNLPKDVPPAKTVESVLGLVRQGKADVIDAIYGPPLSVVSQCLRSFFTAKPGHVLIAGDFANVEGRGVAWLSGEAWKLKAFRESDAGTGPGLYELAYAKSFGVPVESIKNPSPERQAGKVQELAFGFGGGKGAARKMLPFAMRDTKDEVLEEWKVRWRAAHPMTVKTWRELESAALSAVRNAGEVYTAGCPGRQVKFKTAGSFLWCLLPSGRALCYPYAKILEGDYGPQLTYFKVPGAAGSEKIVHDPKNASNWARVKTYGGSLMENVIQALCRDLLVDRMLYLDSAGASITLHVHDEVVIEVSSDKAVSARAAMQAAMRQVPAWAAGFPLFAKCDVMDRYGQ